MSFKDKGSFIDLELPAKNIVSGRFPLARFEWTLDKLLKGAGASADPIEIDVPAAGNPDMLITYILNGTAVLLYTEEGYYWATCFPDDYTDLAIQSYVAIGGTDAAYPLMGRMSDPNNFYNTPLHGAGVAADHLLIKRVAGTGTVLATEAVDITATLIRSLKLSCGGTTIKSYRADLVTARLTATDTALASGKFGLGNYDQTSTRLLGTEAYLLAKKVAAGSPSPQPIAYFEVPIIGSGTGDDPYRARMPELLADDPTFGKTNRLALTHSSLIPTDTRGQPLASKALVRVLDQPARQPHLQAISTCIAELKAMFGVMELPSAAARARAKILDSKLTDYDLLGNPRPTRGDIEDYILQRRQKFGVDTLPEDAERYLKDDKGWI